MSSTDPGHAGSIQRFEHPDESENKDGVGVRVTHRKTKIANLESASAVQQEVRRLDVAATASELNEVSTSTHARSHSPVDDVLLV